MAFLISYSRVSQKNNFKSTEEKTSAIYDFPKVDVEINLNDSILRIGDKIILNIKLTNNGNEVQKILFDKPEISTGGPWATTVKVINLESKTSVLKYENKAVVSSQFYSEDLLKNYYYNLKPKQSIEGKYSLSDIVVINKDNFLTSGTYEIQLFYYMNSSNTLKLTIK